MLSGGTKWPSMMSTWIVRAPASSTAPTCSPSRAKSAARIEGATPAGPPPSDRLEHRAPAVVAGVERGARHAHDRRVLAAVRAHRGELEAAQAVHAAVAPGQVARPQPRLVAGGADVARDRRSRRSRRRLAPQARDEEPVGPVPVRERLQEAGHARMLPQRRVGAQVVGGEVRALGQERLRPRPRSRRARSCRWSTRACRPGAARRAPARRIAACSRASRAGRSGALRQRASGREASVPRSEHGGSTSTRS